MPVMTLAHVEWLIHMGLVLSGFHLFVQAIGSYSKAKRITCGWLVILHVIAILIVRFG